jgi:predicted dehydrogenase
MGIAVVGAGYWGPNLVRNFSTCPKTHVRWLCDLDIKRAHHVGRGYPTLRCTNSLEKVLRDDDVVGVAIATPIATHAPLAMKCLDAGKHVLIEKPLACTVQAGEALVEVAAKRDLVLMCDHTFCYTGVVRRMRQLVQSGEMGEIIYFDSVRINLGLFQADASVLWDLAPHDLSIMDYVLPSNMKPIAVAAQAADVMNTGFVSVAYMTLHFPSRAIAHVNVSWLSPVKIRMTLVGGTRRMLAWDDMHPAERLKVYDKGVELWGANSETRHEVLISYRVGDMWAPNIDGQEALQQMVSEFASAIEERRAPETDGLAGLRVLRTLDAADRSIRRNGVQVNLENI